MQTNFKKIQAAELAIFNALESMDLATRERVLRHVREQLNQRRVPIEMKMKAQHAS